MNEVIKLLITRVCISREIVPEIFRPKFPNSREILLPLKIGCWLVCEKILVPSKFFSFCVGVMKCG